MRIEAGPNTSASELLRYGDSLEGAFAFYLSEKGVGVDDSRKHAGWYARQTLNHAGNFAEGLIEFPESTVENIYRSTRLSTRFEIDHPNNPETFLSTLMKRTEEGRFRLKRLGGGFHFPIYVAESLEESSPSWNRTEHIRDSQGRYLHTKIIRVRGRDIWGIYFYPLGYPAQNENLERRRVTVLESFREAFKMRPAPSPLKEWIMPAFGKYDEVRFGAGR
ncbi:hypothetical protein KKG65_02135 [Patescibacteria group bacterium]|nr:hypothetical protein [Patescibacteria group bacterium]MBU1200448.1 hypothetical protein [Patescibacteria group bacterium]MBU1457766.1 hypothetical protein [Patescibacteria group bacterium]